MIDDFRIASSSMTNDRPAAAVDAALVAPATGARASRVPLVSLAASRRPSMPCRGSAASHAGHFHLSITASALAVLVPRFSLRRRRFDVDYRVFLLLLKTVSSLLVMRLFACNCFLWLQDLPYLRELCSSVTELLPHCSFWRRRLVVDAGRFRLRLPSFLLSCFRNWYCVFPLQLDLPFLDHWILRLPSFYRIFVAGIAVLALLF